MFNNSLSHSLLHFLLQMGGHIFYFVKRVEKAEGDFGWVEWIRICLCVLYTWHRVCDSFFLTLSSPKFTIWSRLLFFVTPANEAKTSLKVRYPFLKYKNWVQINVVQQYLYYKLKGISENHLKKINWLYFLKYGKNSTKKIAKLHPS